jgi:asparagine synthase (glutamine-hydrolysing)
MCGFNGELIWGGSDRVAPEILTAARDRLTHRGPDDAGLWVHPTGCVGLASRRLSILDLSPAGRMPMSNEDGTVWIAYNGEIYNHTRLRVALERRGHRYRSQTDTETIVHLFEEHGLEAVPRLDGMFAFALWDDRRQELLLVRDPLGKKPLYYYRATDRLIFASEIKALLAHPAVPKRLDPLAMYHYLTLSVTPAPQTMFAGIRKLPPGHLLQVDAQGRETMRCYWTPLAGPPLSPVADFAEAARELRYLLQRSVAERMMSDVPFGVFLSGGVDSTTNVALMSRLMDRPVDTFTVALEHDPQGNELAPARQVATRFGCRHHEQVVTTAQFLEFVDQMPYFQDEPLADPVCVPLYFVSKLAREQGVIVIQVGEGNDEIFAGYTGYQDVLARERWARHWRRWVPPPLSRSLATLIGPARGDFLRRLAAGQPFYWGSATAFYETEKRAMATPALARAVGDASTWDVVRQWYAGLDGDFLNQITVIELRHRLAELLLMRVDKMGMANSIEARVPYLDQEVVEFGLRIPAAWKVRQATGKYIFREAVRDLIPAEVLQRPKQGFCGSTLSIVRGPIRDRLAADIRADALLNEYVRAQARESLLASPRRHAASFKLWNLWNLALWHRRWLA